MGVGQRKDELGEKRECQGEGQGALKGGGNGGGRKDEIKAGRRKSAQPRGCRREPGEGDVEAEVREKERGRPGWGVVGRAEVELCANRHTQMDGRKTEKERD